MAGFSSKVATITWVGNVSGLTSQTGKSVNGQAVSTIRHSVWKAIMTEVDKHYVGESFPAALPRYTAATMLAVPNVQGYDLEAAKAALITSELNVAISEREVASSLPPGTVASTTPEFGELIPRGSIVTIYVSAGGKVAIPSVRGLSFDDAFAALESIGLVVSFPQPSQLSLLSQCDAALPNNVSLATLPETGTEVSANSAVVLIPNRCG